MLAPFSFMSGQYIPLSVVTTSSPQTVTIQEWNCTEATLIVWGDGQTTSHPANTGTTVTHQYATAGSYVVRFICNPLSVREIDFRTTALRPNTAYLRQCKNLTYLRLEDGQIVFDSAHIAAMPLIYLSLSSFPNGSTVAFDSAHISEMALTILVLTSLGAESTMAFDSAHIATMALTYLYLANLSAGGTWTIAANDFDGFSAATSVYMLNNRFSQAQVDAILQGLYAGLATRTVANGTVSLGGNNLAPSGLLQAPPDCEAELTGKECAYELTHDSCSITTKEWLTVSITA